MPRKIRPIRIDGDVAYVTLTSGFEAIIDAADADLVGALNWCVVPGRNTNYAFSGLKRVYLHRFLMAPGDLHVDHISGDGLDNRRANMRLVTRSDNMCNSGRHTPCKSPYKGVSWHEVGRKWHAQIQRNKKSEYLGLFETPEAARDAYIEASKRLHGEFRRAEQHQALSSL